MSFSASKSQSANHSIAPPGRGRGGVRPLARKEAVIAAANDFPSSLLLCHFHSSLGTCVGRSRNRVPTIIWVPVFVFSRICFRDYFTNDSYVVGHYLFTVPDTISIVRNPIIIKRKTVPCCPWGAVPLRRRHRRPSEGLPPCWGPAAVCRTSFP